MGPDPTSAAAAGQGIPAMDELLHRSPDLVVRAVPAGDEGTWIVTFDHFAMSRTLDRPGFGEAFLRHQGWSAVHVLSAGNDWYQYPAMADALAAIRARLRGAVRIVTYGSSMGGYAALRFAGDLGAHGVLALSPQHTIDRRLVPWEKRWPDDAARIRWLPGRAAPRPPGTVPVVVYDPMGVDRRHAGLIAAEGPCTLVPLPFAGHPATTFLGELHLLGPLVAAVRMDAFDAAAFRRAVRAGRNRSCVFLGELALRQPPSRAALALRLVRRGIAVAPGANLAWQNLATVLGRQGQHDEAVAALERAVHATGRSDIGPLYDLAAALLAVGRPDDAIACMAEVIALAPTLAYLRLRQARMLARHGRLAEAVAMQASVVALAPGVAHRRALWTLRARRLLQAVRAAARARRHRPRT